MSPISFSRHRFPPAVIRHAVWLYFRFTLSFRDVEELLAERGIEVSYETVRRWVLNSLPCSPERVAATTFAPVRSGSRILQQQGTRPDWRRRVGPPQHRGEFRDPDAQKGLRRERRRGLS